MPRNSSRSLPENRAVPCEAARTRRVRSAIYVGATLLLGACVPQGNGTSDDGPLRPRAGIVQNIDDGPAANALDPNCPGEEAKETVPDLPLTSEQKGGISSCDALDPGAGWSSVPVLAASERHDLKLRARSGTTFDVCVEGARFSTHYQVLIDVDGNASTGSTLGPWRSLGAEVMVENGVLLGRDATGTFKRPIVTEPVARRATGAIVMHIDKKLLPGLVPHAAVTFRTLNADWKSCGWLPGGANHASRLAPASPSRRAQRGMIIPTYALVPDANPKFIPAELDDTACQALLSGDTSVVKLIETRGAVVDADADSSGAGGRGDGGGEPATEADGGDQWAQLAAGAAKFKSTAKGGDYWVAVSGPESAPFRRQLDFDKGRTVWDPIRDQGGKIFGYVHTNPDWDLPEYLPVCQVLADVVRWKKGYPDIDGIWIDEFFPQFEQSSTRPQGETQFDPRGGYNDQLTSKIRELYPDLLLIGNVGALLLSDRLRYGELVDVACTFESALDRAAPNNWSGLTLSPIIPTYGQLALIHWFSDTNPCRADGTCAHATLSNTVERAFDYGYSHVFLTHGVYHHPDDPSPPKGPPLWQDLPDYFSTLVGDVAEQVKLRAGR